MATQFKPIQFQLIAGLDEAQRANFHKMSRLILDCISAYQRSMAARPDMPFIVLQSALANLKLDDVLRFMLAVLHYCGYISVRVNFGVMVFYSTTGKPYSEEEVNQAGA